MGLGSVGPEKAAIAADGTRFVCSRAGSGVGGRGGAGARMGLPMGLLVFVAG